MSYKKGKSFRDLINAHERNINDIDKKLRGLAYRVGVTAGSHADRYVPIDTSNLINSRTVKTEILPKGVRATLIYSTAYAAALHSPKRTSHLNWQPKKPGTPGKPTGGYNAEATKGWIDKGFADAESKIDAMFKRFLK